MRLTVRDLDIKQPNKPVSIQKPTGSLKSEFCLLEMILEVLLIFPLYAGIFVLFFRFRRIIKAMTEIDEIFSALSSEDDEVSKRDFLVEKIKNGETISNSKTPWTVERLEKASDKVVDKLYEKIA